MAIFLIKEASAIQKLNKYKPTEFMLPTSHYDEQRVQLVIKFIENLRHTKAEWYAWLFVSSSLP